MSKNIELLLYRALCDDDGCREGSLAWNGTSEESKRRYFQTMKTVQRYIAFTSGIEIDQTQSIIWTEQKALELIAFVEQNIKGAEGIIFLQSSSHGKILFDRKIRFNNSQISEVGTLTEKLKESDFQKENNLSDEEWKHYLTRDFLSF